MICSAIRQPTTVANQTLRLYKFESLLSLHSEVGKFISVHVVVRLDSINNNSAKKPIICALLREPIRIRLQVCNG